MRLRLHDDDAMRPLTGRGNEAATHERAISSLSDRTSASLGKIRALLAQELSRLELGARVHSYLPVLAASSARDVAPEGSRAS